ncbi:hypothetical protein [Gordonia phage GTE5]|uniref:Uncharacterized protein n=1 Tax=Gordonia phage GTE5 TaxID=319522 RepID=G8EJR6_9CAUD|nr:hypothetical protein GoPhGTE5p49 [Gordonia phage GTE5]AET09798.1 hypothetical protein [Gordonia phage GTE5]
MTIVNRVPTLRKHRPEDRCAHTQLSKSGRSIIRCTLLKGHRPRGRYGHYFTPHTEFGPGGTASFRGKIYFAPKDLYRGPM